MSWKLAASLESLRSEINALYPKRDKRSDGTKGDDAHAKRKSDHNPDSRGIVRGMDITHDPSSGCDSYALAHLLVSATPDPRLAYVISNGQIASRAKGWKWRKYTGANAHKHHVHISVEPYPVGDSPGPWGITKIAKADPTAPREKRPVLRLKSTGDDVKRLQAILKITVDGDFGPKTDAAVRSFQKAHKLLDDGVVGPATWDVLE